MDTKENPKNLSKRIRLQEIWSNNHIVTQAAAAATMGVTQSTVSQYLNGTLELNTDIIIKFAKVLTVYPYDIDPELDWRSFLTTKERRRAKYRESKMEANLN